MFPKSPRDMSLKELWRRVLSRAHVVKIELVFFYRVRIGDTRTIRNQSDEF